MKTIRMLFAPEFWAMSFIGMILFGIVYFPLTMLVGHHIAGNHDD